MSSSRILVAPPAASLVQAADVTARLGISRASLYAYVSRGLIRSYASPDDPRQRLYAMDDVDALLRRRTRQRRPAAAAATALDWGLPVLETGITQIRDGRPFYRGRDAIALAEHASLEETARILLPDLAAELFASDTPRAPVLPTGVDGPAGFLSEAIRRLNASEPPEEPVAPAVSTILHLVAAAASGSVPDATPIHRHLAQAWRAGSEAVDPIRRALVLSADHELSTSAFAVRVVASTGATLSKAVIAGLAALSGPRHGGMTDRVRAFFADHDRQAGSPGTGAPGAARLFQDPKAAPGFRHPLYPEGDPRGAALVNDLPLMSADAAMMRAVEAGGGRVSIDVGLVLVERSFGLPKGAAFALFAIGRTVGWLAHALEQRKQATLIRPRALYTVAPDALGPKETTADVR